MMRECGISVCENAHDKGFLGQNSSMNFIANIPQSLLGMHENMKKRNKNQANTTKNMIGRTHEVLNQIIKNTFIPSFLFWYIRVNYAKILEVHLL